MDETPNAKPGAYFANICSGQGCQWRENRAEIERLQRRVKQLETLLASVSDNAFSAVKAAILDK